MTDFATETRYLDARTRVQHGRNRERQIADALKTQAGLKLTDATDNEDKTHKIDRWLVCEGKRQAVQIKYRESGDDLLFEVFDRWEDWNHPGNKTGRDMVGKAELYAVLRSDRQTVNIVQVNKAKKIIETMIFVAQNYGWTEQSGFTKILKYRKNGVTVELKVQRDPGDGRQKMVAYIPAKALEDEQLITYKVKLPKEWK